MNKPLLFGILSFFVALVLMVILLKRSPQEAPTTSAPAASNTPGQTKSGESHAIQRKINVKLFFTTPGSKYLVSEERSVPYQETLLAQAREVLSELVKVPSTSLVPTIPKDTKFLDLFISKDGIAYADFSEELISNHPGGTNGEISTVYSIVNTLTLNFPQIKRVQILVDSKAIDTLKGHIDLSRPLAQDLSFVSSKQPAPESGVVEKEESWNTLGESDLLFAKWQNAIYICV
jgi:spore germination protein GerM